MKNSCSGGKPKRPRHRHRARSHVQRQNPRGRAVLGVDEMHGRGARAELRPILGRARAGVGVERLKLERHAKRLPREEKQSVPRQRVVLHPRRARGKSRGASQRAPLRRRRHQRDVGVVAAHLEDAIAIDGGSERVLEETRLAEPRSNDDARRRLRAKFPEDVFAFRATPRAVDVLEHLRAKRAFVVPGGRERASRVRRRVRPRRRFSSANLAQTRLSRQFSSLLFAKRAAIARLVRASTRQQRLGARERLVLLPGTLQEVTAVRRRFGVVPHARAVVYRTHAALERGGERRSALGHRAHGSRRRAQSPRRRAGSARRRR